LPPLVQTNVAATPQQFEDALAAVQKGPLPSAVLDRLTELRQTSPVNHARNRAYQSLILGQQRPSAKHSPTSQFDPKQALVSPAT
jgi:hypothetical protein